MSELPPNTSQVDFKKEVDQIYLDSIELGFDNNVAFADMMSDYPKLDDSQLLKYYQNAMALFNKLQTYKNNLEKSNFKSDTHDSDLEKINRAIEGINKYNLDNLKTTLSKRGIKF